MGLAYNKLDVVGSSMWSHSAASGGDLFRLASGWMLARPEIVRLINGLLTGPSTTAGTQMALNTPMFFKALKYWLRIRNPTNRPVRYKLYKCTLNHDAIGGTRMVYTEATATWNCQQNYMGASTYDAAGNWPGSQFWKFWNQRNLFGTGANSLATTARIPFYPDQMLIQNNGQDDPILPPCGDTSASTAGSGLTAHTCFEALPQPTTSAATQARTAWLHRTLPLTKIFPYMRKQLNVRVVASGSLGPFGSRQHRFSHRMLRKVNPIEWLYNDSTASDSRGFMKGYSHFFVIRAYSPVPSAYNDSAVTTVDNKGLGQWSSFMPQLMVDWRRQFQCRILGDSVANYQLCYDSDTGPSQFIGQYQSGFRNGFAYDVTGATEAQGTTVVDRPTATSAAFAAHRSAHPLWTADGPPITPAAATPFYLN